MGCYLIVSEKKWHDELFLNLEKLFPKHSWVRIKSKEEFTLSKLQELSPIKIFIPHWSYIIPSEIFLHFECIVFHMTDLPYGRGGSPLQNLIIRGHKDTKISALRVIQEVDAGPVYLKSPLSLQGTATEIFSEASTVIQAMISKIILENIRPKPADSNILKLQHIEDIYDHIRMMDAEGYPPAFLEFEHFRLEFSEAKLESNKILTAHVRIIQK